MRVFRDAILAATVLSCVLMLACTTPGVNIATTSMPNGVLGKAYSFQLQGQSVSVWSVESGILPPGLQLSPGGLVTGTPTVIGTFSFVVQANQDSTSTSPSVAQPLTVTITAS